MFTPKVTGEEFETFKYFLNKSYNEITARLDKIERILPDLHGLQPVIDRVRDTNVNEHKKINEAISALAAALGGTVSVVETPAKKEVKFVKGKK